MRFAALVLLLAVSAPAVGANYQATPATPPAAKVMSRDILWRCGNAGCTASYSNSSAATVCGQLARKVGRLDAFAVNGTAFDAAALARCNAKAR